MFHRALAADFPTTQRRPIPCDRTALRRLTAVFEEARPMAFLIGAGRARSSEVIDRFVEATDDQASFVHVSGPFTDVTSCMRAVIRSIGFDSKDFGLTDLEHIFKMFLSFQRTHGRRTVICIDEAQDCSSWVVDKVFEIAELEMSENFGLLVILSGRRKLTKLLSENTLHADAARTGRHIFVAPMTLAETREFVIQQAKSESSDDISHIFELEAISRLHEISAGVPDTLGGLCDKSLELAAEADAFPVTARVIDRAARSIGLIPAMLSEAVEDDESVAQGVPSSGRLILRLRGQEYGEYRLDSDSISIGRDRRNDLRIMSPVVSRHHALIAIGSAGVKLMDLGSTNGTAVNGEKVNSRVLKNGDSIVLGDCQIEYVAADHHVLDEIVSAEIFSSRKPAGQSAEDCAHLVVADRKIH